MSCLYLPRISPRSRAVPLLLARDAQLDAVEAGRAVGELDRRRVRVRAVTLTLTLTLSLTLTPPLTLTLTLTLA